MTGFSVQENLNLLPSRLCDERGVKIKIVSEYSNQLVMSAMVPGSTHRYVCSLSSGPSVLSRRDHLFPVKTGSVRFQKHCSCSGCWPVPPDKGESEPSLRLWVEFCVSSSVSELEKLCWEMKQLPIHACLAPSVMQMLYLDGQYPTITTSYKPRASFFLNADSFSGLACLLASIPAAAGNSPNRRGHFLYIFRD